MATVIGVIGESGSGKTTSLRNLDPSTTYIIDADGKGLCWRGWRKQYSKAAKNYSRIDMQQRVVNYMRYANDQMPHIKTVVVDTINGVMVAEERAHKDEKNYDKWADLAWNIWDIITYANTMRDDMVVVLCAHSETVDDDNGRRFTRILTNGRKLNKLKPETKMRAVLHAYRDDDDELTDDCLSILHQAWCDIENEGRSDIGVVAGLTVDDRGCQICYDGWHGEYCDTDYISMEWTRNHPSENLLSRRSDVIEKANVYRDDGKWLYDKVSLVLESVLWNRVAEKYKTRYVRKVLRIYHREGIERLSLDRFDRQKCINYTFSNYVMLNELQGRYRENVKDTFKYLAEYLSCGIAIGVSPQILFHNLQSKWLRVAAILLLPAAYCVGGYFRFRYF